MLNTVHVLEEIQASGTESGVKLMLEDQKIKHKKSTNSIVNLRKKKRCVERERSPGVLHGSAVYIPTRTYAPGGLNNCDTNLPGQDTYGCGKDKKVSDHNGLFLQWEQHG